MSSRQRTLLSIVVPLFNEESNIASLYERLLKLESRLSPVQLEIIFVDDCSQDSTSKLIKELCDQHENLRLIRLAKNSGSHAAIMAGIVASQGDCVIFLAGDLQDPPELIPEMLEKWEAGNGIVWATRKEVPGQRRRDKFFSSLYWKLAYIQSNGSMPAKGVDFFLIDRKAVEAIAPRRHCHAPIFQVVAETGFKSAIVSYTKADRAGGKSGWTFKKKVALVFETLLVSALPLRIFMLAGLTLVAIGVVAAAIAVAAFALLGPQGNALVLAVTLLIVTLCVLTGLQMTMLGVVGEYLVFALKESRHLPRFVVAERVNFGKELAACQENVSVNNEQFAPSLRGAPQLVGK